MSRILGVALALALAGLAAAKAPPEARQRNDLAKTLFRDGKYADAAREWERVYELTARAEIIFNLGQCYRNVGKNEFALKAFRKFLDKMPEAPNRAEVEAMIRDLEQKREGAPAPAPVPAPAPASGGDGAATPALSATLAVPEALMEPEAGAATGPAPGPAPESKPLWKKWWFWTAVGAVAVTAVVIVVATRGGEETLSCGEGGSLGGSCGQVR